MLITTRTAGVALLLCVAGSAFAQRLGLPSETLRWEVKEWAKRDAVQGQKVDYGAGVTYDPTSKAAEWTEILPLDVTIRGDVLEVDGQFTAHTATGHNLNRLRMIYGPKYQMVYNYAIADPLRRNREPYGVMVTPTKGHGVYSVLAAELTPMVSPLELTFLAGIDRTKLYDLAPNVYFSTKLRTLEYSNSNPDLSTKNDMFRSPWRFVIRDDEQNRLVDGESYEVERKVAEFTVKETANIGGRIRPKVVVYRRFWPTKKGLELQTIRTFTLKEVVPAAPLAYDIPASLQVVDYRLTTPDLGREHFPLPEDKPVVYEWSGKMLAMNELQNEAREDTARISSQTLAGGGLGIFGVALLFIDTKRRRRSAAQTSLPNDSALGKQNPSQETHEPA